MSLHKPMKEILIFISSTIEELKQERKAVADAINQMPYWKAIYAESFPARAECSRVVCLEEVRQCHIYIGIFKDKYGYIPKGKNPTCLSATALEYQEAIKCKMPTLIFVYNDKSNREKELAAFLAPLMDFDRGHFVDFFSCEEELVKSIREAIQQEVSIGYITNIAARQRRTINNIYESPYFKNFNKKYLS